MRVCSYVCERSTAKSFALMILKFGISVVILAVYQMIFTSKPIFKILHFNGGPVFSYQIYLLYKINSLNRKTLACANPQFSTDFHKCSSTDSARFRNGVIGSFLLPTNFLLFTYQHAYILYSCLRKNYSLFIYIHFIIIYRCYISYRK